MDDQTAVRIYDKLEEIKNDSRKCTEEIKIDITKLMVEMAKMPCAIHDEKIENVLKQIDEKFKGLSLMIKSHWAVTLILISGLITIGYKSFA